MDEIMKVLDHSVREIKREVNLRVLKVPEIQQKVLDATSDEPWGPHGSDLADIARATNKLGECQIIMNVLWQRLENTDANWRHLTCIRHWPWSSIFWLMALSAQSRNLLKTAHKSRHSQNSSLWSLVEKMSGSMCARRPKLF
ncbi:hypothetical protein ACQ4PT_040987 [Festuca glaucescens]